MKILTKKTEQFTTEMNSKLKWLSVGCSNEEDHHGIHMVSGNLNNAVVT